ncbi:MAG: MFS transporter [Proteobacteria bacterium]|nr:MFS transporter [Pseudomonadota bacterium]
MPEGEPTPAASATPVASSAAAAAQTRPAPPAPTAPPAPAGHTREAAGASGPVIAALVAGQLGLHSAMAGLRMAAPLQALGDGYSTWAVGILLALFAAAPVLVSLPAGRLADRHGYHRPVRYAVFVSSAGMLLAVLATYAAGPMRFALLCVAAALAGAGANTGMLTIQRSAGLAARDGTERVRVFSWLGIAPSFSNVLGPVAVGFTIDGYGFRAGYVLLLALPLLTVLSARRVPRLPGHARSAAAGRRRAWDLLESVELRRLLVVNWLMSMGWDVHTFAVPVLGHERGFDASTIGLILGSFTLAVTGVRVVIPLLAHRLRQTTVLHWAMIWAAAVFAAYPLAPNPWLMGTLAAALGLALGSVQPMIMSMLHQVTPDARHGEALALRSMAMNTSSTLMPLLFGATGALVGAAALFWAVGGAVGAGSRLARRLGTVA